jgi:hypothetical protein
MWIQYPFVALVGVGAVEWPVKGRMTFYHNGPTPNLVFLTLSTYTLTGFFLKNVLYFMVYLTRSTDASQGNCNARYISGILHVQVGGEDTERLVQYIYNT